MSNFKHLFGAMVLTLVLGCDGGLELAAGAQAGDGQNQPHLGDARIADGGALLPAADGQPPEGYQEDQWLDQPAASVDAAQLKWAWQSLPPLIVARQHAAAATVNGKVYIFGGCAGATALDSVERYDPIKNIWEPMASLPFPLCTLAAAAIGNIIYVAGGATTGDLFKGLNRLYIYDSQTNRWIQGPVMPRERKAATAVAWQGKLLVVGGEREPQQIHGVIDLFDPATQQWTSLAAPLPTPRNSPIALIRDNALYVVGGAAAYELYGSSLVERYSFANQLWVQGPPLLTERCQVSGGVSHGHLIVAGGWGPVGHLSSIEALGPNSDHWTELAKMATPRAGPAAAVIDQGLLIAGGGEYLGLGKWKALSSVELLVPLPAGSP